MTGGSPPRVVVRLDFPGGRIGHGKVALLEAVASTGSLAGAARTLGMSYPRALDLVAQVDGVLGTAAVLRRAGGSGGGQARLTEAAARLLARYRAIEAAAQRAAASA
jgi:molybdate transport system regulatory protein